MPDTQTHRGLTAYVLAFLVIGLPILVLITLGIFPELDYAASAAFHVQGVRLHDGFPLSLNPFLMAVHNVGIYIGWILAPLFALCAVVTFFRKQPTLGIDAKAWLFLLATLIIGPGLLANIVLKDHWGRARPYQITSFSGNKEFTPFYVPSDQCGHNCSFVAGDPSFGFFMPTLAYVVLRRKKKNLSRWFFWGGMACGTALGIDRLIMGAHFLSDILAAGILAVGTAATLHTIFYDRISTRQAWKEWLSFR